MFLVMSAAFVGQELESEFGRIPPSFLPLGNRRLFQHQIALAPEGADVYLSIPESFSVSTIDMIWLTSKKVTVLTTPDGLSLGASLVAALNISGHALDKPLHVLYGDTLYHQLPVGDDIVSISQAKDSYNWAVLTDDSVNWVKDNKSHLSGYTHKIIDGYFKFSNPRELIKCITQCEWNFIEGLNRYHQVLGLTSVESNGWLDFGHVNTYYRSKAEFTTQRAFNELTINPNWIEKSSLKNDKIAAEANWFATLPFDLRGYIPQYLGSKEVNGKVSYRLEYLHLTALNELFVFSELPSHIWNKILSSCIEFLSHCYYHKSKSENSGNSLNALFTQKTEQRLDEYCQFQNITLDNKWIFNGSENISIRQILFDSQKHLPNSLANETILHGDFCFSNILYDFRSGKIKTIDPRGVTPSGERTIYGDLRYDIAKLSHSILGLYDWIIAGYYQVNINVNHISFKIADENRHKEMQQNFIQLVEKEFQLTAQNLYAMQIQLFLSMLPLHADDPMRQKALFANVFRLHQILVRLEQ
ncbi:capsular biosynthesis protein (plasmid) [Proteus mirabilis]|uniref:capsular biosynthesis protein n=1 Tax=Proteus mirabilis TaxID=584 RepID=UPI0038F624E2